MRSPLRFGKVFPDFSPKPNLAPRGKKVRRMRIEAASRKNNFEQLLSTLPPPIAELAADMAAVPSSKTSMIVFATAVAKMLEEMFKEGYGRVSPDLAEIFVEENREAAMSMADWAASVGDVWKEGDISFQSLKARSQEWHDALADNANEAARYPFPDETVLDLGNGWRIVRINPKNADAEGSIMGHCFGRYGNSLESGTKMGFSIRDAKNRPHVTFDVKSLRTTSETDEEAKLEIARDKARSQIGMEFQNEVPIDTPNYVQAIADFFGSGDFDRKVEKLAREMVERGEIRLYGLNEVQAKGNTPPPDRYRGIISKFLEDNHFEVDRRSLKDKLTPSDELFRRMASSDDVRDMVHTSLYAIPTSRRGEAIKMIFDSLEDPMDTSWMVEDSDAYDLLKLLSDEVSQNPKNPWVKSMLSDMIVANPFLIMNEDVEYLVKDLYDTLGGDKWLSSLLSSSDVDVVEAGIAAVKFLGLDYTDPAWRRAISNATMNIIGESDSSLPAPDMEDFSDPLEALNRLKDIGVEGFYDKTDIFSKGPVGEKISELYADRPADVGPYLEQIPWRVLKGLTMIPDRHDVMTQGRLFESPRTQDDLRIERKRNRYVSDLAESQIERGREMERREKELQPNLFQLACLLDDENPEMADGIDRHLLRRGS